MAGKIRKGFTTYLLVLFIALVSAFLICVTVMLFSPFKNILGFKYFFYEDEAYEYNVTGGAESEIFDMSKIEEIKINCSYAKVTVERYVMVDNHAVRFTNKSKGFARDSHNTDFTYELSYEDSENKVLKIDVHEPEGFLYFSKEVSISILVPTKASYALNNTKIDVTNTSGNVYIGNDNEITTEGSNIIDLNSFSVKTNSGKVTVYPLIDNTFNDIFIKSTNGDVAFSKDIVVTNKFELHSTSGEINFKGVQYKNSSENAVIDLGNSKFNCSTFIGNITLGIKSGYFDLENINGNIVSNASNAQMGSAKINIGEIDGVASFPFANKTTLNVDTLTTGSELYFHSTSGNVNVKDANGKIYVETQSGNVNINTNANDIQARTKTGDISVSYNASSIADQLDFITESGDIDIKIKSNLEFVLVVYDLEANLRTDRVNVEWISGNFTNPLYVNCNQEENPNKIKVVSNGDVTISLLEIA